MFCYNYEHNNEDVDDISKRDRYLLASILHTYAEKSEQKDIKEIAQTALKTASNIYI